VWDASFVEGSFDQTDLVFGSGGRIRESAITFVSAGSTVDRLQFAMRGNCTFISNSLVCLLEGMEARLDPTFRGYDELFEEIIHGIDREFADLLIVGGRISFTYFHNLIWDGAQIRRTAKPEPQRDFGTFENYTTFLGSAMQRIGENMASRERARPLEWLGTISRGYDGATCAALARDAGLKRVLTYDESRPGIRDDGAAIAAALDLECILVKRLAWKSQPSAEPLFLSADAQGKEVMLIGAREHLDGVVLVTGHGGDTGWATKFVPRRLPSSPPGKPPRKSLVRSWHSGLSMTEYRLHAGFIHLPAPFMGLRQLSDLLKLSNSAAMASWDIGHPYSRPICRRVLEEAGVPRDMFGTSKTGASIRFLRGEDAWSREGKRRFFRWLRTHGSDYGMPLDNVLGVRSSLFALELALLFNPKRPNFLRSPLRRIASWLASRIQASGLSDLAFIWATDIVQKTYRAPKEPTAR
jgi:hypothetical protein